MSEPASRAIVGWFIVTHIAFAPFALTHLDFARDVLLGFGIATGRSFPLEGPVLASTIHLGPVWNYALAAALSVSRSWLAVCVVVAALESAKFALAYMLGKTLWNRDVGLLWAAGLALPGWTLYAQVLPTHPSLVETLVLAFMLCVARFHLQGGAGSLVAAAVAYALALHAHPTTFPILLLAVPPVVQRLKRGELRWRMLMLACAAALVWFAPAIYQQFMTGFADIRSGQHYLASAQSVGDLRGSLAAIHGWFVTGPRVLASDMLGWGDHNGEALAALLAVWTAVGLVGAALALKRARHRATLVYAALVALCMGAIIVAIRSVTPYYFLYAVWPIVAGIAALGLHWLFAAARLPGITAVVLATVLVLSTAVEARAATTIASGKIKLGLLPLFDVKAPFAHGSPTPLMPAYAMREAGVRYCDSGGTTLHGALAFFALHDYGVEASLVCGSRTRLILGGPREERQADVVGLSKPMVARLGITAPAWFGPIGVLDVARSINPRHGYELPQGNPYPPIAGEFEPLTKVTLEFSLGRDDILVASNAYFAFTMPPAFSATVDGNFIAPIAADAISTVYACPDCASESQAWRLTIVTPDVQRVDVVTIRRR